MIYKSLMLHFCIHFINMKGVVLFVVLVVYYARTASAFCPKNKTLTFHHRETVNTCNNSTSIIKTPGCTCRRKYVLNEETNDCILPKDCPTGNRQESILKFPLNSYIVPLPEPKELPKPIPIPFPQLPIPKLGNYFPTPVTNPIPTPGDIPIFAPYHPDPAPLPKPGNLSNPVSVPNPIKIPYKLPVPAPNPIKTPYKLPVPVPNPLPKPLIPKLGGYLNPSLPILEEYLPPDLLNPVPKPEELPIYRIPNPAQYSPNPLNPIPSLLGLRSGESDPLENPSNPKIFCSVNKTYLSQDIHVQTCDQKEIRPKEPGCYCKNGYFLDIKTNLCVLPKDCPARVRLICGVNQVYAQCKDTCNINCFNHNKPPKSCPLVCIEGCDCKPGYVWLGKECIPTSNCPSCPANKTYRAMDISLSTCDNIVLFPQKPSCYCKDGYVYNRFTGHCILKKDCPKEIICARNEKFDECATPCPKTCSELNPYPCYSYVCQPSCVCMDPYVRNESSGKCILPQDCQEPKCGRDNEEFKPCGTKCQPTCAERTAICTLDCHTGCFCREGYIRDKKDGRCILIKECPAPK